LAEIHGASLDSSKESRGADAPPLFGDPEQYKHLSPEKREEMTSLMREKYKKWAGNSELAV
jgi:hypothetical protein